MSILEEYRCERRLLEIPDFCTEGFGTVIRYGPFARTPRYVCFTKLPANELDSEVQRHTSFFESIDFGSERNVYGSDEPKCLRDKSRRGLRASFASHCLSNLSSSPTSRSRHAFINSACRRAARLILPVATNFRRNSSYRFLSDEPSLDIL